MMDGMANIAEHLKNLIQNTKTDISLDSHGQANIRVETPRLIIRPVQADDLALYQKLFSDLSVMNKYADGELFLYKDDESQKKGMQNYADHLINDKETGAVSDWKSGDFLGMMTVEIKKTREKIGGFRLVPYKGKSKEEEVSALMLPEYWNNGYATEAGAVYLYHILPELIKRRNLQNTPERLIARVREDNLSCLRLLEKCGFEAYEPSLKDFDKDLDANKKFYSISKKTLMMINGMVSKNDERSTKKVKSKSRHRLGCVTPHFKAKITRIKSKSDLKKHIVSAQRSHNYDLRSKAHSGMAK